MSRYILGLDKVRDPDPMEFAPRHYTFARSSFFLFKRNPTPDVNRESNVKLLDSVVLNA